MRRSILLALVLSGSVWAQSALTTITGTLFGPGGSNPSGTATISWGRSQNDAQPRQTIFPGSKVITITAGIINTQLFPNSAMLPVSTCYTVDFNFVGGVNSRRYWTVPISATPVDVGLIEGNVPCPPQSGVLVAPAQIANAGATIGQVLAWNGTYWAPANSGGGGGSSLFANLLTGVNNSGQVLTVGSTSTLTFSGSGIINANRVIGTPITGLSGNSGRLAQGSGTYTSGDAIAIDSSGNLIDSGFPSANVILSSGSYSNPSWITSLAGSKITGGFPCSQIPALTGDATTTGGTCLTSVLTTGGTPFAPSATTNALNASNISSGTLPSARLPAINLAASGAGGVTGNLPVTNLNGGVGASGSTVWAGDGTWKSIAGGGTVTNTSGPLIAGRIMIGNGGVDSAVLSSLGTNRMVLHGNAGGSPSFFSVQLNTDVTGVLPPTNGGTNNDSFAVTGPNTSIKNFTFPNADAIVLTNFAAVTMAQGGTGADLSAIVKGGLISGTGGGTVGITTVGTNGQVLSADSGSTGGVKWIAASGGGSVTSIATTGPITGGPITTTGTLACPTCNTSAAALTLNQLVIGQGLQAQATLGSLGTTVTVLHGNAGGIPAFSSVSLTADVSGILPGGSGGTNNPFMSFAGPSGASRVYTLPNATTTILTTNAFVTPAQGGTGADLSAAPVHGMLVTEGVNPMAFTTAGVFGTVMTSFGTGTFDPDPAFAIPETFNATIYNFAAQSPSGTLSAGVPTTATLVPVPRGVNGSNTNYYLRIPTCSGGAQTVLITGGTAVSGSAFGSVAFTPTNSCTAGWTITSAGSGIPEAINAAQTAGGGKVFLPAGSYVIRAPLIADVTVDMEGTGRGSVLDCTNITTVCAIRGDTIAGHHTSHESATWSHFRMNGPGFSSTAWGILMGGDPAGVVAPTNLEGHDLVLRDVYIANFSKGIYGGNNSYSNSYYEYRTGDNGHHFYIGNSTNCCSDERFYGGRMIGATVAAIQNLAYSQIRGFGTTIEYNRRGFYEDGTTGGGTFECDLCEWETYTDNPADPECVSGTSGQPICGAFIDVQSVAPFTLTLTGGVASYATFNATYRATNYLIVSGSQNSVAILNTGFGGNLSSPVATNIITHNSTTPATSFLDLKPAHYPSFGVTNLFTTSTITRYSVRDPNTGAVKEGIQAFGKSAGANVASAATITPTGGTFFVTGNTPIDTMNLPYVGFEGTVCMVFAGGSPWSTTLAGNFALASTAVAGKPLCETYMGSIGKWYPSY